LWVGRCLAHIINLATQALITTRSKAKFYSPDNEDTHIPETRDERDELGLVRAICVKVLASSRSPAPLAANLKSGTIILTTQGAIQGDPRAQERNSIAAPYRHESSLGLNICHVE